MTPNFLPFSFSYNLNRKPPISSLDKSEFWGVFFLRPVFRIPQLPTMYKVSVHSCMEYSLHVWGGSTQTGLLTINHREHTLGAMSASLPYGAISCGHALRVIMKPPFPSQVTLSKRHWLATAISSMGSMPLCYASMPLCLSMGPCLLHTGLPTSESDKQVRLPDSVPHVYIAAVGVDGLCW